MLIAFLKVMCLEPLFEGEVPRARLGRVFSVKDPLGSYLVRDAGGRFEVPVKFLDPSTFVSNVPVSRESELDVETLLFRVLCTTRGESLVFCLVFFRVHRWGEKGLGNQRCEAQRWSARVVLI